MPWHQHKGVRIYRAVDFGYSPDPAYCVWIAHLGDRFIAFKEKIWFKTVASDIAKDIVAESMGMRIATTYADPSMAIQTGADVRSIMDIFEENGVPMEKSVNNRIFYAHAIHTALAEITEDGLPRLQIYSRGCPYLIKSLPLMRFDERPNHTLAMADHKHDHPCVALAYFLISFSSTEHKPFADKIIPKWMRPRKQESQRFVLGDESVRVQ